MMIKAPTSREVWAETKKFLAKHGLDFNGLPKKLFAQPERRAQQAFERSQIRTPTGGVNGRHR